MFETVNDLSNHLQRPAWTGNPTSDRRAVDQYIANGMRLRNEAFGCMGRALIAVFRRGLQRVAYAFGSTPSHQV